MKVGAWSIVLITATTAAAFHGAAQAVFEVEIASSSPAEFHPNGFKALDSMMVFRSMAAEASERFPQVYGSAESFEIHRYETSWVQAGTPYTGDNSPTLPPNETVMQLPQGSFQIANVGDQAAVAMVADELEGLATDGDPWRIRAVARDPAMGMQQMYESYGTPPGRNEPGGWFQRGDYILLAPQSFHGQAHGAIRVYWFDATLVHSTTQGNTSFLSRYWDDPSLGPDGPYVRHAVWYELWMRPVESQIVLADVPGLQAALFASEFHPRGITTMSFDSADRVDGSLPETSGTAGPSLWVTGDMDGLVRTLPSDGGPAAYAVRLSGRADGYAYGGDATISLTPLLVSGGSLLLIAAGMAIVFRDFVAKALSVIPSALFTRLDKKTLLRSRRRDTIFGLISASPGLTLTQLQEQLGQSENSIGMGNLVHHLRVLEEFGLIRSKKLGRFRRYYSCSATGAAAMAASPVLDAGRCRAVADALLNASTATATRLHSEMGGSQQGLSLPGVRYILNRLERQGLVTSTVRAGRRWYRPAGTLRQTLVTQPTPLPRSVPQEG